MFISTMQLDPSAATPLYLQLIQGIIKEIIQGDLAAGDRLPSIRTLAKALGISRITVENAYNQLMEEGYLISKPQSGYFAADLKDILRYDEILEGLNAVSKPGTVSAETRPAGLRSAQTVLPPVQYNFRSNYVDSQSFNSAIWRRYVHQALKAQDLLTSYGEAQGEEVLRYTLAKYSYEARDVKCTPDQIVVGAGIQSLLHILCGVLKDRVAAIGIQSPGFFQAEQIFRDHGFKTEPFSLDMLDSSKPSPYGLVCINPSNPYEGGALPSVKRVELLKWASRTKTFILEDDYIGEFRYLSRPIPSLQGMSNGNSVIYMGSFSRTLVPSLRISYMVLPLTLLPAYQKLRDRYNQTSSGMEQLALAGFIADGHLSRHIRHLRKIYAAKNHLLQQTLQQVFGNKIEIASYESGLRVLLLVNSRQSAETLAGLALEKGIAVIPVSANSDSRPQIMLSYAGIPEGDIPAAVQALARAWSSCLL